MGTENIVYADDKYNGKENEGCDTYTYDATTKKCVAGDKIASLPKVCTKDDDCVGENGTKGKCTCRSITTDGTAFCEPLMGNYPSSVFSQLKDVYSRSFMNCYGYEIDKSLGDCHHKVEIYYDYGMASKRGTCYSTWLGSSSEKTYF